MGLKDELSDYQYQHLVFYVNGKRIDEPNIDPRTTLAAYLRDNLKLTGTKIGCNEGGCGACAIMISDLDPVTDQIRHYSSNACLTPLCAVFGKAITTAEGIGTVVQKKLHPIQERLAIAHGSQCGFCTPGFVMAMYSLLRNNPKPTEKEVDEALQGNLCRCTGYRPILEAYYTFCENGMGKIKEENGCALGENCCKNKKTNDETTKNVDSNHNKKLTSFEKCKPYDPTQELIFPPELKLKNFHKKSFVLSNKGLAWYQPTSLEELLRLKRKYPHARIISGNSELAIELKFRFIDLSLTINPKQITEMRENKMVLRLFYC
jgi:xanthine dehydrogenase/oxidase